MIPQQRILEKLNHYMNAGEYDRVRELLLYWMKEARAKRDLPGQLFLLNEMIGHYRKTGQKEEAFACAEEALELIEALDYEGTVTEGTTLINAATAFNAFGESRRSLPLFEKARRVYEADPATEPSLLGGLYNNMAIACQNEGLFPEAFQLYEKALALMKNIPGSAPEQAITYLNMADATAARDGMLEGENEIHKLVEKAYSLLQDKSIPRDGYFAFVCEKCAPGFSYYGYFAAAARLREEAYRIYAQNGRD